MAAIRVPRWPCQEETCGRQPRGVKARCTLRGGREWSAKDLQLSHKKNKQDKARGRRKEKREKKSPTIITVDESGNVRNWGPLSKTNAWRAGSYWEEMDREAQVFIEKDDTRRAVQVENGSTERRSGSG